MKKEGWRLEVHKPRRGSRGSQACSGVPLCFPLQKSHVAALPSMYSPW